MMYVNVPLKSNKQNNLKRLFFVSVLKVNDKTSRIRIHTKMSWIRNTGSITFYKDYLCIFVPPPL